MLTLGRPAVPVRGLCGVERRVRREKGHSNTWPDPRRQAEGHFKEHGRMLEHGQVKFENNPGQAPGFQEVAS